MNRVPYRFKNDNKKIGFLEDSDFTKKGEMDLSENSDLTLKGKVNKDDLCMIMVYADWCPHCVDAKPVYDEIVNESVNINFFKINGSGKNSRNTEKELMKRINVILDDFQGFPSFYFFRNGKKIGKHSGQNTKDELKKSITKFN